METYIRRMEFNSEDHVIVTYSDGTVSDIGYLPTRDLTITYRRDNKDENK